MQRSEFLKYLNLYGSDVKRWPEGIRKDAFNSYNNSPELQKLVEKEYQFEELLDALPFEETSSDLTERIIMSAGRRPAVEESAEDINDAGSFLYELFLRFLSPKPVMALALTLIVGFVVGYSEPLLSELNGEDDIVAFLYNGEDML
jgi:hypothetical protein